MLSHRAPDLLARRASRCLPLALRLARSSSCGLSYGSANPSPLSSHKVITNRLRSAAGPVVPHRGASARILFVEPESSGSQTGAAFVGQRVRVDRFVSKGTRSAAGGSVEHAASVARAIGTQAGHFGGLSVVQARRNRSANNRHAYQRPGFAFGASGAGFHAYRELVPHHRTAMPVQLAHKLVGGFQVAWHHPQQWRSTVCALRSRRPNPSLKQRPNGIRCVCVFKHGHAVGPCLARTLAGTTTPPPPRSRSRRSSRCARCGSPS